MEKIRSFLRLIGIFIVLGIIIIADLQEINRRLYNTLVRLGACLLAGLALFAIWVVFASMNPGDNFTWNSFIWLITHWWLSAPVIAIITFWGYLSLRELELGNCSLLAFLDED